MEGKTYILDDYDDQADYYEIISPALMQAYKHVVQRGPRTELGLASHVLFAMTVNVVSARRSFPPDRDALVEPWKEFVQHLMDQRILAIVFDGTCLLWRIGSCAMYDVCTDEILEVEDQKDFQAVFDKQEKFNSGVDFSFHAVRDILFGDAPSTEDALILDGRFNVQNSPPFSDALVYTPDPEASYSACSPDLKESIERYARARGVENFSPATFASGALQRTRRTEDASFEGALWSAVSPLIPAVFAADCEEVSILEVGAGDGTRSSLVQEALKSTNVFAIDVAPPPLKDVQMVDHRLLDSAFDVVVLNMVVHHVARLDVSWVRGIANCLNDGGILVVRDHNWDGTNSHAAFLDALHCVHSQLGDAHTVHPVARYYTQDELIRIFSSVGLAFCPIADPESNSLYSGGGRSNAMVLYFSKTSVMDYPQRYLSLAQGVAVLHAHMSAEAPSAEDLEARMGVPRGYLCIDTAKRTTVSGGPFGRLGSHLFSANFYGKSLLRSFAERGERQVVRSKVKEIKISAGEKKAPSLSASAKSAIDFSEAARRRAEGSTTPSILRIVSSEPPPVSEPTRKQLESMAIAAEVAKQADQLPDLGKGEEGISDEDLTNHTGPQDVDEVEDSLGNPLDVMNHRIYTTAIVARHALLLLKEILISSVPLFGITEEMLVKIRQYRAFGHHRVFALFWYIVIICRMCMHEALNVNGVLKKIGALRELGELDKRLANSILYGLNDCGWLRQRLESGPPVYKFDAIAAKERGGPLQNNRGAERRF